MANMSLLPHVNLPACVSLGNHVRRKLVWSCNRTLTGLYHQWQRRAELHQPARSARA